VTFLDYYLELIDCSVPGVERFRIFEVSEEFGISGPEIEARHRSVCPNCRVDEFGFTMSTVML
jgi:hypothetical protein